MRLRRSEDLSVVEEEHVRRLWRNLARRGWKLKEPLDDQLPIEKSRLLHRAFELSIREEFRPAPRFAKPCPTR